MTKSTAEQSCGVRGRWADGVALVLVAHLVAVCSWLTLRKHGAYHIKTQEADR